MTSFNGALEELPHLPASPSHLPLISPGALEELRCERLKLEADLKTTDLRKLVLVQELRLLKEFEKNDITLASRLEKKHAEKSEIVAKVAECQERLALKKVEIEKLLEKDKLIMAEMSQALGEGNKYSEVLLTIFKKKVDLGEI